MICTSCSGANSDSALFCSACGMKLSDPGNESDHLQLVGSMQKMNRFNNRKMLIPALAGVLMLASVSGYFMFVSGKKNSNLVEVCGILSQTDFPRMTAPNLERLQSELTPKIYLAASQDLEQAMPFKNWLVTLDKAATSFRTSTYDIVLNILSGADAVNPDLVKDSTVDFDAMELEANQICSNY